MLDAIGGKNYALKQNGVASNKKPLAKKSGLVVPSLTVFHSRRGWYYEISMANNSVFRRSKMATTRGGEMGRGRNPEISLIPGNFPARRIVR